MLTALITANVFHNSLPSISCGADFPFLCLSQLNSLDNVKWYVTEVDYTSIWYFWTMFGNDRNNPLRASYLEMISKLNICHISNFIEQELKSPFYQYQSVADAIRLACAINQHVDAIVTWEANHFARSKEEKENARDGNRNYLNFQYICEYAEDQSFITQYLDIYSPRLFWLFAREPSSGLGNNSIIHNTIHFQINSLSVTGGEDGGTSTARLEITDFHENTCISIAGNGTTLIAAIQNAIDSYLDSEIVQRRFSIPNRTISCFQIPGSNLESASSPIELLLGVECQGRSFRVISSSSSVIQAAANAYIQIINWICCLHEN